MTSWNFSGGEGPHLPELHNTVVVAAFEGWNDAGDAASDALEHLDAMWEAQPILEIDDESYYDYQVNRPVIRQVDGVTRELVWPSMQISHCRPPGSDRDIVLMHGVEPNMRWRSFCAELLGIAEKLNVDTVVILGALLADTPHTRPVPVSGAAYSPESAKFFGLLAYILCGTMALKRGKTPRQRLLFLILALVAFAYIVGVALTRNPLLYAR